MGEPLSLNLSRRPNTSNTIKFGTESVGKQNGTRSTVRPQLSLNTNARLRSGHNTGNGMHIQSNTLTLGNVSSANITIGKPKQQYQMNISGIKSKSIHVSDTQQTETSSLKEEIESSHQKKNRSYEFELFYHDSRYSSDPLYLDVSAIPGAKNGDLAVLKTYHNKSGSDGSKKPVALSLSHSKTKTPTTPMASAQGSQKTQTVKADKKIYFILKDFPENIKRRTTKTHISMLYGDLQKAVDIPNRSVVYIKLKDKQGSQVDLVELNVKDCNVNRGDMWLMMNNLHDTCVFTNQRLDFANSLRFSVSGIYSNGKKILSGYIGERTKIIVRSESARLVFIIQITEEMWHFEEDGEIMFHKVVNSLFPKIIKKWKKIGTHHNITIAFSANVNMSSSNIRDLKPGKKQLNSKDYYRIVVDQINIAHWRTIMETLRKEFTRFKKDLLNVHNEHDSTAKIQGKLSPTVKTNLLESVNLATTLLLNPFRQVDLRHTTTHVIIISPGTGLFDVDYDLLKLTTKKLLSLEVTMDIICLSSPPLHIVPLFRYRDYSDNLHYCIPTWLSISFWKETNKKQGAWQPSCKIYDLQMMGVTENEVKEGLSIDCLSPFSATKNLNEFIESYDQNVFTNDIWNNSTNRTLSFSTEIEKKIDNIYKVSHDSNKGTSNFTWQLPKSGSPTMDNVQIPQIFADSQSQQFNSENADINTKLLLKTQSSIDSLQQAVKSAKQKQSELPIPKFAQKLVSTLFKTSIPELKKDERSNSAETKPALLSSKDSITDSLQTFPSPTVSISPEKIEKLKNLNKLSIPLISVVNDDSESILETETAPKTWDGVNKTVVSNTNNLKLKHFIGYDSWIEIENPSTPFDAELATELIPARWKDVYPKYIPKRYSKWRSFTTPADLPVTTGLFPSIEEFEEMYELRNHSVTANPDKSLIISNSFELLRNIIYVRLLCGFQICTSNKVKKIEKSVAGANTTTAINLQIDNYLNKAMYLAMDDEIHRVCCNDDGVIEIRQYTRKQSKQHIDLVSSYLPMIKTRYENDYRVSDVDPLNSHRDKSNWNQVDQYLAGYGENIPEESKKRFKSKFVLLSSDIPENSFPISNKEVLSDEEIRLEGLRKLISLIYRSRARSLNEKKNSRKEEILPEIFFYTGSLNKFIEDQEEMLTHHLGTSDRSSDLEGLKFSKDTSLESISCELQCGKNKIDLVTRRWHWNKYENCFIGSLLVNWLLEHFDDIETREDAVAFGEELMKSGLFIHVLDSHRFLDGHYFYQISPKYLVDYNLEPLGDDEASITSSQKLGRQRSSTVSNKSITTKQSVTFTPLTTIKSLLTSEDTHYIDTEIDNIDASDVITVKHEKPSIMLSSKVVIDLNPSNKESKREVVTVHFDKVHNPLHCFHIRLEWLSTSPKLVDDLINSWSRVSERYGLKLVEIPWKELCVMPSINPFYSHVDIKLAINPWTDAEFMHEKALVANKFYYHTYLLEYSGFLLDNRGAKFVDNAPQKFEIVYSWGKQSFKLIQYIHKTGAYIAEIRENGDLFLAPNNIHLSRVNINTNFSTADASRFFLDSQKIMLQFKKTCLDYDSLKTVFQSAKANLSNSSVE